MTASNISARLFAILTSVASFFSSPLVHAQTEVPLWHDGAPGLKHDQPEVSDDRHETGRVDRYLSFVSTPTLTIYPAPGDALNRPAVLVVPGGGFRYICIDKEGIEAAHWLNSIGLTAAVLKYRTMNPAIERSGKTIEALLALGDIERAMRVLRANASAWKIDPSRIGVMGFSAGGVMSLKLLIDSDAGNSSASDPVEKASSRPDFIALVYTGLPGGKWPKVDASTPPVFIAHASDDPKAPALVATKIYQHLQEGGASAELHIFSKGDHGFGALPPKGSVRSWTTLCAGWLRDQGILPAEPAAK
ncbi:hypothetical protein CMV30_01985 [Nibricoccus aquaticus]|uniref:BD-FAE-like domain-containing protein n=1 Tax=Nibricoccus aquaticus TaxID=2576891 RepID=A0A290Q6M6_9BACT|nr:alpha/beta hydrolase [Nibricoccus aquaticus]ATC62830.1 hypothetical protein CMV30_01985 [Nibricoccus aquaticus]